MPVDLERLKDVDSEEWNQEWQVAWTELELWDVAVRTVRGYLQWRFPQHVESVAQDALLTLSERGIRYCRTVDDIVPLLRKIAREAVVTFLRRSWVRREVREPENEDGEGPLPEAGETNLDRLRDEIAERLHLEGFDLEVFVDFLVREATLSFLEEALLREHILGGCTQQEFADWYGLRIGSIGGRKERVIRKIRELFFGFKIFL